LAAARFVIRRALLEGYLHSEFLRGFWRRSLGTIAICLRWQDLACGHLTQKPHGSFEALDALEPAERQDVLLPVDAPLTALAAIRSVRGG